MGDAEIRVPLPRSLDDYNIAVAVFACLELIGSELSVLVGTALHAQYDEEGRDWPAVLQDLHGRGTLASAKDLSLILKELLRPGPRVSRSILPRDKRFLGLADQVLQLRNRTAHSADAGSAIRDARTLTEFTSEAGLRCAHDVSAYRRRLEELHDGTFAAAGVEEESAVATAAREDAVAEMRAQLEELEARNVAREQDSAKLAFERDAHVRRAAELEKERDAALVEAGEARAAADAALVEARQARSRSAAAEADRRHTEAERVEARAALVIAEVDDARAKVAVDHEYPNSASNMLKRLEKAASGLAATRPVHEEPTLARTETESSVKPSQERLPGFGQPWPYAVGTERWKLSKLHRTLTAHDDGSDLSELVPEGRDLELIDQFLGIRPEGGKVFVDDDMDAVTWMNDTWVYLGRLDWDDASGDSGLEPGTILDGLPKGRKYRMLGDGTIAPAAGGDDLATIVGTAVAADVVERVRAARPTGGRLWVDRDGLMTTVGINGTVVVTTVADDEWFPG